MDQEELEVSDLIFRIRFLVVIPMQLLKIKNELILFEYRWTYDLWIEFFYLLMN